MCPTASEQWGVCTAAAPSCAVCETQSVRRVANYLWASTLRGGQKRWQGKVTRSPAAMGFRGGRPSTGEKDGWRARSLWSENPY
eukprot:s1384_g6.t1